MARPTAMISMPVTSPRISKRRRAICPSYLPWQFLRRQRIGDEPPASWRLRQAATWKPVGSIALLGALHVAVLCDERSLLIDRCGALERRQGGGIHLDGGDVDAL